MMQVLLTGKIKQPRSIKLLLSLRVCIYIQNMDEGFQFRSTKLQKTTKTNKKRLFFHFYLMHNKQS